MSVPYRKAINTIYFGQKRKCRLLVLSLMFATLLISIATYMHKDTFTCDALPYMSLYSVALKISLVVMRVKLTP